MLRKATSDAAIMSRRQAVDHRLDRHLKENGLRRGNSVMNYRVSIFSFFSMDQICCCIYLE
jgi:hypothetical protein